jgi:mono/diheme cytochrome c family protein
MRNFIMPLLFIWVIGTESLAAAAQPAIEPIEPPVRASFDAALVAHGAQLAAIGNCKDCHTAPEGKPYAGGLPVKTPFGTIYATNITPDAETGIGRWSETAFRRAMHEGVDRQGHHLYPAFPYDHFTKVTDDDVKAIYAFVMTREPVRAGTPPNQVPFPFNIRGLIGVWKGLFFERGRFQGDPAQSAELIRGAYLVEAIGHCGACHTPRNFLGAERKTEFLAGGETQNWHAPALTTASPAPVPWTAEQLYRFLRYGFDDVHEITAGPMAAVTHNLAAVPEQDVRAIAAYIASLDREPTLARRQRADEALSDAKRAETSATAAGPLPIAADGVRSAQNGAAIYAGACALCHDNGRTTSSGSALHLALSTSVANPTPGNLISIIVQGITPREGERGRWMPAFAGSLTAEQVSDLVAYLRADFGKAPAWRDVEEEVRKVMQEKEQP